MLVIGAYVASVKEVPVLRGNGCARADLAVDVCFGQQAALTADVLALLAGEGREKVVKARVAWIAPVEAASLSLRKAAPAGGRQPVLLDEQPVPSRGGLRRALASDRLQGKGNPVHGMLPPCQEQARTRNRCEGNGGDELGIVGESVSPVGRGPAVIEDVFATGVRFAVEGEKGGRLLSVEKQEVARRPCRSGSDGSRVTASLPDARAPQIDGFGAPVPGHPGRGWREDCAADSQLPSPAQSRSHSLTLFHRRP